ncbi:MAG TPA: hypothetical protein VL595_34765 [Pseudonocardia sp.]|nr:hypothetical protein [Pseudonocardia sp.]
MDTRDPAGGVVLRFRPPRPVAVARGCEPRVERPDIAEVADLVDVATRTPCLISDAELIACEL